MQSGVFGVIKIDDIDGAGSSSLTDISTTVRSIETPRSTTEIDVTTFATNGGQTTRNTRRGAVSAPVTITADLNSTTAPIAQRLIGRRNLSATIERHMGLNAIPTTGGAKFTGEYALLSIEIDLTTGKDLHITEKFQPSAASTTVPQWTRA